MKRRGFLHLKALGKSGLTPDVVGVTVVEGECLSPLCCPQNRSLTRSGLIEEGFLIECPQTRGSVHSGVQV